MSTLPPQSPRQIAGRLNQLKSQRSNDRRPEQAATNGFGKPPLDCDRLAPERPRVKPAPQPTAKFDRMAPYRLERAACKLPTPWPQQSRWPNCGSLWRGRRSRVRHCENFIANYR